MRNRRIMFSPATIQRLHNIPPPKPMKEGLKNPLLHLHLHGIDAKHAKPRRGTDFYH